MGAILSWRSNLHTLPCTLRRTAARHSVRCSRRRRRSATPRVDAPWRIIVYFDEVLPGNIMNHKGAREMWACYWSFVNFGSAALAHEDVQVHDRIVTQRKSQTCL